MREEFLVEYLITVYRFNSRFTKDCKISTTTNKTKQANAETPPLWLSRKDEFVAHFLGTLQQP